MVDPGGPDERFPFPAYPNGWARVALSEDLQPGSALAVRYFGRDLVVFRDRNGATRLIDAHCAGGDEEPWGRVEGGRVICPEHGLIFGGEAADEVRTWPVCERNGFVFAHYDAEGRPPTEEVPEVPECASPEWSPFIRLRWKIRGRTYDMGENAFDDVHFRYLHGAASMPKTVEGRVRGRSSNLSKMKLDTPTGQIDGEIESTMAPGMTLVYVRGLCETLIVITGTPVDGEYVDQMFSYTQRVGQDEMRARLGRALLRDLEKQMNEDIVVFEHKKHWTRPLLCDADAPIAAYRKRSRGAYSGEFGKVADEGSLYYERGARAGRPSRRRGFRRRDREELASFLRSAFRAREVEFAEPPGSGSIEVSLLGKGDAVESRLFFERECLERAELCDLRAYLARPLVKRRIRDAGDRGWRVPTDEVLEPAE